MRTGSRSETCSGTSRDVLRYKQGRAQVNATPLGARADQLLSCERRRASRSVAQLRAETCFGERDAFQRSLYEALLM